VLVGTSRVADAIENPDDTGTLHDAIAEGGYYGMQSFDQSLLQLVIDKAVTIEEAMLHASSKQNFALLLEANDIRIDTSLRRAASGSQQAASDELSHDSLRHGRGAVPVPAPIAPDLPAGAPVGAPVGAPAAAAYEHAAMSPPVTEFLPSIGGNPAAAPVAFPGVVAAGQPAQPQFLQPPQDPNAMPAGPQQPRPQPGITPDLPGHSAA
jgi:hypothetical protein